MLATYEKRTLGVLSSNLFIWGSRICEGHVVELDIAVRKGDIHALLQVGLGIHLCVIECMSVCISGLCACMHVCVCVCSGVCCVYMCVSFMCMCILARVCVRVKVCVPLAKKKLLINYLF
jgi:hypothetical protein